jgi:hypothetical protein
MSLLLNGAKTATIAGTEMQVIEIYTGESYTLPFAFTTSAGVPINCTGWTLATTAKFYVASTVTYGGGSSTDTVVLGNLTLNAPQPTTGVGTYSANLTSAFTTIASGIGYIYIPADLTGGTGAPNATPVIAMANDSANTTLVIVTLAVTRTDTVSSKVDVNKEPIGLLVRYQ